jgi:anti-anti-sigma factor
VSFKLSFADHTLHLKGVVNFNNADACCEQGAALLANAKSSVTVDLAELDKMSSISVAVLLRWARLQASQGYALTLSHVPEKGQAILKVSGLTEALPQVGD